MRASVVVVVMVASMSVTVAGCARNPQLAELRRENAELKTRIATLESQVAELKDRQPQTPITVNGLTLAPLDAPLELELTPSPLKLAPARDNVGVGSQGRLVLSGSGTTFDAAKVVEMGSLRKVGDSVWHGTVTSTRAAATRTTTTGTTTTPAK